MKRQIPRRIFLQLPVIFAIIPLLSCNKNEISKEKKNIILFVSDDHGTDALGCYGNPLIKTPNLDKLASQGTMFTNAYCTSASCAASRSVILTGKFGHATASYGHVHDYHHFSTFPDVRSLPVLLSEAGYTTARIGKYHLAPDEVYRFDQILDANPRSTVEMAEGCRKILSGDEPFFLYFCTDDPHRGSPFKPNPWDTPNNFGNKQEGYPGVETITYNPDEVIVPDFLPDTKECREELAQYYQSVSRIDQGFGRLMEILKETGKTENTIVIYISDNGIAFPGAKTTLYEPGIQLPCIIKDPATSRKGITSEAMISWVDLTPSILDLTETAYEPDNFHGKSFAGILEKEHPEGWDVICASHIFHEITMYYPMRVYRSGKHKLIWNMAWRLEYPFASDLWASSTWQGIYRTGEELYGRRKVDDYLFRPEFELYDLEADPGEVNNLVSEEAYRKIFEMLKKEMKAFQLRTKDPWIIMWDHDSSMQGTGVNL